MGSLSHLITPLVINSLGADTHTQTHTHTQTCIPTSVDKVILISQAPARAWFKNNVLSFPARARM